MNVMLTTALLCNPGAIEETDAISQYVHQYEMHLSDQERDRIRRECEFAIQKMYSAMDRADREAEKITDINVRNATVGAIEGAVAGLSTKNPYAVVIGGCLGALGRIGGDAYIHFCNSRDHVRDAEYYARIADELQERLWRDR